jgi:hypothetical protein
VTVKIYRSPQLVEFIMICNRLPDDERGQYEAFTGEAYDPDRVAASHFLRGGPSWVVVADGEPIVIAGFDMVRDGVWQDWLLSTPVAWERHWRPVTRLARHVMDFMLQGPARRLQCVSLASRIHAHRWYRPLGLRLEGTLSGYGVNGEDALMFSRLRSPDGQQ